METQDQKKPNISGHGGVHICSKCGWPYPNAHPSSKNRRAHKKVCGTIDKYRLDNDAQEKTHVEDYDGELHSDDEFETPSDKGVKRTISRRSSSGVGSRSSRSNRSEDELFTDAVTEFNESPAGEASGGAIQRFYSMQNELPRDDIERAEENPVADNLSTIEHLNDNQLQTVENVDGDKVESGLASQDHISTKPSVESVVVTSEIDNTVDQKIEQSSEPYIEPDMVSTTDEEIKSSKDESKIETSSIETLVEVADVGDLKGACDEPQGVSGEHLASVSASGLIKTSSLGNDVESDNGRFDVLESSEREKIGNGNEAVSLHEGECMNSGNGNTSKSELFKEGDSKIGSDESVYDLLGSDVLPLEQLPEIEVEDVDHIRIKNSISESPNATVEIVDYSKGCSIEEGSSDIAFNENSEGERIFSEDFGVSSLEDKQGESQKYVGEQKTFGEPDHISDVETSNADVILFKNEGVDDLKSGNSEIKKDGGIEEKKPITSLQNNFLEGATIDAGKTTSNEDSARSDVEDAREYITVMDTGGSEVVEDDLAVRNSEVIKPTLDDFTEQDSENLHISTGMGNDENNTLEGAIQNENEISDRVTPDRIVDHGKLDRVLDSGDLTVGHSEGESLSTSQFVGEIESSEKKIRTEEFKADDYANSTLKTHGQLNSTSKVEVDEDADRSSATVDHCSDEKVADDTSRIVDGGREIKQPVTISAVDTIVDSGSMSDSLDGNWGSVSVMSTTSDAIPTSDPIALHDPRSLEGEENPSMVPKHAMETQHSQNQVPIKPEIGIQQLECVSEIHPSPNEPNRGKKDKEIIDKVSNWDSGKQNTPLKALLGEATARSRAESPIHHYQSSTSTSVLKTDVISGTNNGLSAKTENVILNSDHSEMDAAQEETGKEWNSPARYPVNIKTEKRRSKSTFWAPFLCCSSVNAR
ncbi:hypothetical protein RND81_12G027400 [Saponaria officinalis]|uniref:Uncharacterized protein n=1 Tax=Saponaria officinalis TaxID=3572 RepID=A0AAW1H4U4_SAPOF